MCTRVDETLRDFRESCCISRYTYASCIIYFVLFHRCRGKQSSNSGNSTFIYIYIYRGALDDKVTKVSRVGKGKGRPFPARKLTILDLKVRE